jgi:tetratricopeptide (TPR) repeat protein
MERSVFWGHVRSGIVWLAAVWLLGAWQGCASTSGPPQKTGPSVQQLIEEGNALVAGGEYEAAVGQYNRALAMDITSAEAHGNLSVAYYYLGRYDEAIREAQQAIVMAPTELNWRFNLGAAYSRKGDHERAMAAYQGTVDLARRVRDEKRTLLRSALIGLGRACELAGQYPEALDAYREALVFSPDDVELMAGVGNIHFRQGEYGRAEEAYRQALAADSTHAMSRYNLGLVYAKTGRYEEAVALFSGTPGLPDRVGGSIESSALSAVGRSRVTRTMSFRSQFGRMGGPGAPQPARSGKQPPYTYALGLTYYEQGDDAAAIEAFRRALQEDPLLAEAHLYIGNMYVRQGRMNEAISSYKEAIQANPQFAEAYNNMGSIYAETGHTEEAMAAYRQALALDERFYDARTNLGLLYAEAGRYEEAVSEYIKVIKADVGIAEAHNNLSMLYLQQGKLEEAIAQSRKAIGLRRDFPEAYNNLGLAYAQHAYVDDVTDVWRSIASAWSGGAGMEGQDRGARRAGWLLLRRVPANSSGVGGAARDRYREGVDRAALGQFDGARRSFEAALQAQPGWHAAQLAVGSVLLAQERWGQAVEALQAAAALDATDPLTQASLAIAQAMHGAYGAAVKAWEQAVRHAGGETREAARAALETMRERCMQADEALGALRTAVQLRPDFAKAHFNLGVLYDQLHRYEEAVSAYERVAQLAPDIPVAQFRLGVACHRTGRFQEAQAAIQRYIALVTDPMLLPQVETFLKRMK